MNCFIKKTNEFWTSGRTDILKTALQGNLSLAYSGECMTISFLIVLLLICYYSAPHWKQGSDILAEQQNPHKRDPKHLRTSLIKIIQRKRKTKVRRNSNFISMTEKDTQKGLKSMLLKNYPSLKEQDTI